MEPCSAARRWRDIVRLLASTPVRVAGTAVGVVLLLHGVDAGAVMRSLAGVDAGWLSLSILLTAGAYALSIVEWGVLLRAASAGVGWLRIGSWQVAGGVGGWGGPRGRG